MQAVDAAEGPEVEDDDFATQVLQGEVLVTGVEPGAAFEFAGAHAYGAGGVLAHGFSLLLGAPCVGAMVCCPHYASVVGVVRRELSFVTWGLNGPSYSVTFHPGKSYRIPLPRAERAPADSKNRSVRIGNGCARTEVPR